MQFRVLLDSSRNCHVSLLFLANSVQFTHFSMHNYLMVEKKLHSQGLFEVSICAIRFFISITAFFRKLKRPAVLLLDSFLRFLNEKNPLNFHSFLNQTYFRSNNYIYWTEGKPADGYLGQRLLPGEQSLYISKIKHWLIDSDENEVYRSRSLTKTQLL